MHILWSLSVLLNMHERRLMGKKGGVRVKWTNVKRGRGELIKCAMFTGIVISDIFVLVLLAKCEIFPSVLNADLRNLQF